jgi:hypothetical protein
MSSSNIGEVATESTQPQFVRYEDHFGSMRSRAERMAHIIESIVDKLNGAEPADMQPTHGSDKPDVPKDELPMLGRMDRASEDAFQAMNQLERQLERLQTLQLI